jgi:hypothetical protein
VALSNHALESFTDGRVTFRYTHARTQETKRLTLPIDAFIGRFLQHVLPTGFTKIRSYGLLSPSRKPELERARHLLQLHSSPSRSDTSTGTVATPEGVIETASAPTAVVEAITAVIPSPLRCPLCQRGHLALVERYRRSRAPP